MFGRRNDSGPSGQIDSLIGAGTRIEGDVLFAGGLRIDGEVVGNIKAAEGAASSTLVISEKARVEGGVEVAHLVINGTVVGQVVVGDSLEMQSHARIVGDVEYAVIEMHQGAVIDGRLLHRGANSTELKSPSQN